jgi:hypothetical protein
MLSSTMLAKPAVVDDLHSFTAVFADTYFRIVAEAVRPTTSIIFTWAAASRCARPKRSRRGAKYCDVVSFNVYREDLADEEWVRFHGPGKPALIGEFQFGSTHADYSGWGSLMSLPRSGAVLLMPPICARRWPTSDIVGTHWFQYVDEPLTGRLLDGESGHMVFVSVVDVPYAGLAAAARSQSHVVEFILVIRIAGLPQPRLRGEGWVRALLRQGVAPAMKRCPRLT